MIFERAAAYLLAVACVFQMLAPSGAIKPHYWRSIDVQIGWLRIQERNEADSATWTLLLHSWENEPKRLKICRDDSGCLTAWLNGTSHAWMISKDEGEMSLSAD
jgi:hypothetical protein